ncbi:MAG TPA: flavin reductase family protein [Solirubrobacteraceae bacterium]|jgi:flavin reductase (DIM6/NTAB) family NADH-FMN oxidoreductase RutF|nr:flavin reductase family protein [Solirubrobacteraceae bacterium]
MATLRSRPLPPAVLPAQLRLAVGRFATGVTVVTSLDADGDPVGTTASAVSALSLDPPLVLVCLSRASRTLEAVRARGTFAINVLAGGQRTLAESFARPGRAAAWDGVAHRDSATGSPRLEDVLAVLDCSVEHRLPGGDHEIVVGRVGDVETHPGDPAPLLHYRGTYASLVHA